MGSRRSMDTKAMFFCRRSIKVEQMGLSSLRVILVDLVSLGNSRPGGGGGGGDCKEDVHRQG